MEQTYPQQTRNLQSPTGMKPINATLQNYYNNNQRQQFQQNDLEPLHSQYYETQHPQQQTSSQNHQKAFQDYQAYYPPPQVPIQDPCVIHHPPLIEQTYQIGNQSVIQEGPKLLNCQYAEQFPALLTQLNLVKQQLQEERQHVAMLEIKIQNYLAKQQEVNEKCSVMVKWKNKSKQYKQEMQRLKNQFQQIKSEYEKQSLENIEITQKKNKIQKELKQIQLDLKRQTKPKNQPKSETKNCKSANTIALFNEHNQTKMTHLIAENKKLAEENFELKQKNAKQSTRIKFLEHRCKDFQNESQIMKLKCNAEIAQIQTSHTKSILVPSRIINCNQAQLNPQQERSIYPSSTKTMKQTHTVNLMPQTQIQQIQSFPAQAIQKTVRYSSNSSRSSSSSSSSSSSFSKSKSSKSDKSSKSNKSRKSIKISIKDKSSKKDKNEKKDKSSKKNKSKDSK